MLAFLTPNLTFWGQTQLTVSEFHLFCVLYFMVNSAGLVPQQPTNALPLGVELKHSKPESLHVKRVSELLFLLFWAFSFLPKRQHWSTAGILCLHTRDNCMYTLRNFSFNPAEQILEHFPHLFANKAIERVIDGTNNLLTFAIYHSSVHSFFPPFAFINFLFNCCLYSNWQTVTNAFTKSIKWTVGMLER